MADVVKVYRTAAFVPLTQEIKRFGAITKSEASERFGADLIVGALRRRVCGERDTKIGPVLYLLHRGRKLLGMTGAFSPTDDGLMNAVCLRDAGLMLERRGVEINLRTRKHAVSYTEDGKMILVLAQHDGYAFAVLRRLYKAIIDTGEYAEIHMYSYLTPGELEALARVLYRPARQSKPLDPERLRLFALPTPQTRHAAEVSEAIN